MEIVSIPELQWMERSTIGRTSWSDTTSASATGRPGSGRRGWRREGHDCRPSNVMGAGPTAMPPTSVMTRLILNMVWHKLIRNPNTYSSSICLISYASGGTSDVGNCREVHLHLVGCKAQPGPHLFLFLSLRVQSSSCGRDGAIQSVRVSGSAAR